jgi:hypothetical protein
MKIHLSIALLVLGIDNTAEAFLPVTKHSASYRVTKSSQSVTAIQQDTSESVITAQRSDDATTTTVQEEGIRVLTQQLISALPYRELVHELRIREQLTTGTTSQLRRRLREAALPDQMEECIVIDASINEDCLTPVSFGF